MNNTFSTLLPLLLNMQNGAKPDVTELLLQIMNGQKDSGTGSPLFPRFSDEPSENKQGFNPMSLLLLSMMMKNNGIQQKPSIFENEKTEQFAQNISNENLSKNDTLYKFSDNIKTIKKEPDFEEIKSFSGSDVLESLKVLTEQNLP